VTIDVDIHELRAKVRALAERLGYSPADLDALPLEAVASSTGVGQHLELAGLRPGERFLDPGSGSGMDAFLPAAPVGPQGWVIGIDMTDRQLERAEWLRRGHGVEQLEFRKGYIEELPVEGGSIGVVISNGVINLSPDKEAVFGEIARALAPRAGWPSPTSSRSVRSPRPSTATSLSGRRASGGRANGSLPRRDRTGRDEDQGGPREPDVPLPEPVRPER
jgi:SAM-dependent methyltransferase